MVGSIPTVATKNLKKLNNMAKEIFMLDYVSSKVGKNPAVVVEFYNYVEVYTRKEFKNVSDYFYKFGKNNRNPIYFWDGKTLTAVKVGRLKTLLRNN